jgi:hypothetical protein
MQVKRVVQIWYLRRRISRPKVVRPVARGTTATSLPIGPVARGTTATSLPIGPVARGTTATSLPIGPVAWEPLTKMTNTWAIHQA